MAATKKTKEGELVIRISKTIQEEQYQPLIFDATIRETCAQENYSGRIKELSDLLYVEAAEFLGIETELPKEEQPEEQLETEKRDPLNDGLASEEDVPSDENLGEESLGEDLQEDLFDDDTLDDVPF